MYHNWKNNICKYGIGFHLVLDWNDVPYAVYLQKQKILELVTKNPKKGIIGKELCDAYGAYFPMPKNVVEFNELTKKYSPGIFTGM